MILLYSAKTPDSYDDNGNGIDDSICKLVSVFV